MWAIQVNNLTSSIWVDADACPVAVKEMLIRAAKRTGIQITFVANHTQCGDLVITQDIPLADEVITKGAIAIGPRGHIYTKENIKSRLNMRDFMETMRSSGIHSGGPAPLNQQDKQNFANQLDKWLSKI